MREIFLSIVIPAFNEEEYLPRLIKSIQLQSFPDYEIIIADGGSEDRTVEIAESFGCKLVVGGGQNKGRNCGADAANGEYILFLDADVKLPSSFLQEVISFVKTRKIQVASCAAIPLSNNYLDYIMAFLFNIYDYITQFFYPHASGGFCILVKKDIHQEIGGFDSGYNLADYAYPLLASKRGKFRFFWNPKVYISMRRYEKEGRLKVYGTYILYEISRIFLGDKRCRFFKYDYKYKENK